MKFQSGKNFYFWKKLPKQVRESYVLDLSSIVVVPCINTQKQ